MFSVFCKNLQMSVGHMLVKQYSTSSDAQIMATKLCHHYKNSIYAQMHAQDTHGNLTNLCIATWKGTFQAFLNHWESQLLLIDKSPAISNQELSAVHKSMLCNAICSNPEFLRIEHLKKLGQAQGTSEISYHNYLTLLHTPSGLKYLQHFAPHNFLSRVNPKTERNHIDSFCIVLVYFSCIQ